MNFAELRFWFLLAGGVAVIVLLRAVWRRVRPGADLQPFDKVSLAVLGIFLLACVNWLTCAIFLVTATITYVGVNALVRSGPTRRGIGLAVLIPLQLAPLFYFKYSNFVLNQVAGFGFDTLRDLIIPAGLSFYTFQMVAFVLDTLAFKQPIPRLIDYLNFVGFFPQIVAGPIERRKDLLPQMERFRFGWHRDLINEGAAWVTVGLFFKCCLADNLAAYGERFMQCVDNPYQIWMANLLFGLRIYYDFAGYSLVALGLGRCFGLRLTLNFASPYCVANIRDFWRHWHISLSQWFRDYVYVPLGGGRVNRWAFNLAVVFLVSGVWHGAGWNFIFWGGLHGLYLIGYRLNRKVRLPSPLAWALTMLLVFLAWLCFYEVRFDVMWTKLVTLLTPSAYGAAALANPLPPLPTADWITLGALFGLAGLTWGLELLSLQRKGEPYALLRHPLALVAWVALTVLLAPSQNNAFIYFSF